MIHDYTYTAVKGDDGFSLAVFFEGEQIGSNDGLKNEKAARNMAGLIAANHKRENTPIAVQGEQHILHGGFTL